MLRKGIHLIGILSLFLILTVLTQIGGIVLVLFLLIWKWIPVKFEKRIYQKLVKWSSFCLFYLCFTFYIIPPLAGAFGRLPLPIFSNDQVKPLNIMTCILNRHYVKPELLKATNSVAVEINNQFPKTQLAYLDAGFPFLDGFPLLPHLSHDDGEKLDLAFLYTDSKTGLELNDDAPSFIGYGVFEAPRDQEWHQPDYCAKKGNWQYSILGYLVPQWNKSAYDLDERRTKKMIELFVHQKSIKKVFIEPHLKTRMKLTSGKVRYHGCGAVRHDDHIHIQL